MKLATGGKGKTFNDRVLAAEVRTLGLNEIKKALKGDDVEFKKAVILRLAGSLLPRLNEHTGDSGGPLQVEISEIIANKHDTSRIPSEDSAR